LPINIKSESLSLQNTLGPRPKTKKRTPGGFTLSFPLKPRVNYFFADCCQTRVCFYFKKNKHPIPAVGRRCREEEGVVGGGVVGGVGGAVAALGRERRPRRRPAGRTGPRPVAQRPSGEPGRRPARPPPLPAAAAPVITDSALGLREKLRVNPATALFSLFWPWPEGIREGRQL